MQDELLSNANGDEREQSLKWGTILASWKCLVGEGGGKSHFGNVVRICHLRLWEG